MRRLIPFLILVGIASASRLAGAEEPPNVVILLADDLGYRDIGSYDGPVKTPHLDGSSPAGHLLGKSEKVDRHQPLFLHLQKARPVVAMRDGRYSLVADPDYELSRDNMFDEAWIPAIKTGGYTNYQLFDLEKDPNQTSNPAGEKPEVLKRMKTALLKINASIVSDGADWHED